MAIACSYKTLHGPQFCFSDCPAESPCGVFLYERIEKSQSIPELREDVIDIAVLDMNHGWPNLGHDSLVHVVQDAACDLMQWLQESKLTIRVLSYDVRRSGMVPETPGSRFSIYLGTGGPANIDPFRNDGVSPGSQGIFENPLWEAQAFDLFDAIYASKSTVLLGVCHTFGTMCRWSNIADPVLRGVEKGGKSIGILENVLTAEATDHPWFKHLSKKLPDQRRLRILDNRFFDLIPSGPLKNGCTPIGFETIGVGGPAGEAITMMEWSRDGAGVAPRIFAVNHHPEIVDRSRQRMILDRLHQQGNVTEEWYRERLEALTNYSQDDYTDQQLAMTSDYTLTGLVRYYIYREVRLRAKLLNRQTPVHEDQVLEKLQA